MGTYRRRVTMNEKQELAEAERRFENWWRAEGMEASKKRITIKSLLKEAWMNGAFVTRKNN